MSDGNILDRRSNRRSTSDTVIQTVIIPVFDNTNATHIKDFVINYNAPVHQVKINISSFLDYANNNTRPYVLVESNMPGMKYLGVAGTNSLAGSNMPTYYTFDNPITLRGTYTLKLLYPDRSAIAIAGQSSLILNMQLITFKDKLARDKR